MRRNVNWLMVLMSAIGGIVAFIINEIIIKFFGYTANQGMLMGIYFGILSICIGTACLASEIILPKINGRTWKNNYLRTSFKFLIPCTLIMTFIVAGISQFIYGAVLKESRIIRDVTIIMEEGIAGAEDSLNKLLHNLDENNKVDVVLFSNKTEPIQAMEEAMDNAMEEINLTKKQQLKKEDRKSMIIMMSSIDDNFNSDSKFNETIKPFRDNNIPVYTIGMLDKNNSSILKKISKETGGSYFSARDVKDLKSTFFKVYRNTQQTLLNGGRYVRFDSSTVYGFIRVPLIILIAITISAGVSFMFDNKYILKGFIIGGLISGTIAGLILEIGFNLSPISGMMYRGFADIIIAVVFTLFATSEVLSYKESYGDNGDKFFTKTNYSSKNKKASSHNFD